MLDMKGVVVQSVKLDSTNQQPALVPVLHVEQEKLQRQQAQIIPEIVVGQKNTLHLSPISQENDCFRNIENLLISQN